MALPTGEPAAMVGMGAREVVGSGNGSDDSAASLRTAENGFTTREVRRQCCVISMRGNLTLGTYRGG